MIFHLLKNGASFPQEKTRTSQTYRTWQETKQSACPACCAENACWHAQKMCAVTIVGTVLNTFWPLTSKATHKWLLCIILSWSFSFIPERSWKTCIFTQKWLDHLLFMTSYLVSIETDHHQTCLTMRARDKRAVIENLRFRCFIV